MFWLFLLIIPIIIFWFISGLNKITPKTKDFFYKEGRNGFFVNYEFGTLKVMKMMENQNIKKVTLPDEIREKYAIKNFSGLKKFLVENDFFRIENNTFIITNKGLEYYNLRKSFLIDIDKGWRMTSREWKDMIKEWDNKDNK